MYRDRGMRLLSAPSDLPSRPASPLPSLLHRTCPAFRRCLGSSRGDPRKAPGALHVKEPSRPQAPSHGFHPRPRGHVAGHRRRPHFTPSSSKISKHVPGAQQRLRGSGTAAGVLRGWLCVCASAPLAKASVSSSRTNFHRRNTNFPTHAALPFARRLRSQG